MYRACVCGDGPLIKVIAKVLHNTSASHSGTWGSHNRTQYMYTYALGILHVHVATVL